MRLVPLWDAKQLADENKRDNERLIKKQAEAEDRAKRAQAKLDAAYSLAFDGFLGPFATTFALIKNVELGDLPTVTAVPELKNFDVELRTVGLKAVDTLTVLAGGSAAGAAAGATTFAAVGAFATASTGAAISGLGGAAATSATMAWLGGGSLAAGGMGVAGGTMVLTGIVAAPLLLALGGFLWWKGERAYEDQQRVRQQLRRAAAELDVQIKKSSMAVERVRNTAKVVKRLVKAGTVRMPEFEALVARNTDYATYTSDERARVAELAGLATTIASVIACPILNEDGTITALSDRTLPAAQDVAARLAA